MQICSIPLQRADETLYSFAARLRRANAAKDDRDACRSMFGYAPNMRVSEFPVNLAYFCQATRGLLGSPEQVLSQMTLAPLFERLGAWPWRKGSAPRPAAVAGYGLSTLSNGNTHTWRACKQCLRQDRACNPYGYWRRAHQLPGVLLCPTHNVLLLACSAPTRQFHNRFILPDEAKFENTFHRIDTAANADALLDLGRFSVAALQDGGEYLDATTKQEVIGQALESHALLSPRGTICREAFATKFLRCFGFLRHHPDFSDAVSFSGVEILCRSLDDPRIWRRCLHQLLLLSWLFGSWEAFKAQCQWQRVMNNDNYTANLHAEGNLRQTPGMNCARVFHRTKCIHFMTTTASPSRSKFAHAEAKSFRWLLNNDIEWFNQQCPPNRTRGCQRWLF
jgi:hypothetical protein